MAISRRRVDPKSGLIMRPARVISAVARGATHLYARCDRCKVTAEIPIEEFDPSVYIPDAGLSLACPECGHGDIETWPKYPSLISRNAE